MFIVELIKIWGVYGLMRNSVFDKIEKAKRECLKCKHKNSPCMDGLCLGYFSKGKESIVRGFENE